MPRLRLPRLLEVLTEIEAELYGIWIECRNYELAAQIEKQREKLEGLIFTIQGLVEPLTPSATSDVE